MVAFLLKIIKNMLTLILVMVLLSQLKNIKD